MSERERESFSSFSTNNTNYINNHPTLLKAKQNSYGFSDNTDSHVLDVLKLTSSVQLQKYGVLNNSFDPKIFDEVRPKVLLEILSAKSSFVLISLIYVVFICCFIADCVSVYQSSHLLSLNSNVNPAVIDFTPSTNIVYFFNETLLTDPIGVNDIVTLNLNVIQSNISSIQNYTSINNNTSISGCPTLSVDYRVNIWACYLNDGCGPLPSVDLTSQNSASQQFGNVGDDLYSSSKKSTNWNKFSESTEKYTINYCQLESAQQVSLFLYGQNQGAPQLPSRTSINSFGISVAYFRNPYGLFVPVDTNVANSISYKFALNFRPFDSGPLYIFGHLLLLLCLLLCLLGVAFYVYALLTAEKDRNKWVPEQSWAVLYIVCIIFFLNPLDVYGQLFVKEGWQSLSSVDPANLSYIAYIIYFVGQVGFQFTWLLFADSISYRTKSRFRFLLPKLALMLFILAMYIIILTFAYTNKRSGALPPSTSAMVFTIASISAIAAEVLWIILWIFLMIRSYSQLIKLPYMRTRQMQLSFNYFNRCAILYFPYLILEYCLTVVIVVSDKKNGFIQGGVINNDDDVSLINDIDFTLNLDSSLVGKAIFVTCLAFTITFLHLPASLFADPDHNRISSQIISLPVLTEDEKSDAAQSIVASYSKLNKFQVALLEGVAGRNKPFKFSIDLSSILVTLSTEIYIDKKINSFGEIKRKSRTSLGKSTESGVNSGKDSSTESKSETKMESKVDPLSMPASTTNSNTKNKNIGMLSIEKAYDPLFEGDKSEFQFLKLFVDEATQTVCVVGRRKKARRLVIAFRGSCGEQNILSFNDKTAVEVDITSLAPDVPFPPRMYIANSIKLADTSMRLNSTDATTPSLDTESVPFIVPPNTTNTTTGTGTSNKNSSTNTIHTAPTHHTIQIGTDLYSDTWRENAVNEELLLQTPLSTKGMTQQEIAHKSIELRMRKLSSASKGSSVDPSPTKQQQQQQKRLSNGRVQRQFSTDIDEIDQQRDVNQVAETPHITEKNNNCCTKANCMKGCRCIGNLTAQIMSTSAGIVAYSLAAIEHKIKEEIHKYPQFAPKIKVHNGFWTMYSSIRNQLHEYIRTELVLEPADVLVTGHCLGGALSTLCALDLSIHTIAPINLFLNSTSNKMARKRRRK